MKTPLHITLASLVLCAFVPAKAEFRGDMGFETPSPIVYPGQDPNNQWWHFQYNPQYHNWSFEGSSGIAENHSGFTNGNETTPQGNNVAFVQGNGRMYRWIHDETPGQRYTLAFAAAQRSGNNQSWVVKINGQPIWNFYGYHGWNNYQDYLVDFDAPGSSFLLEIQGTNWYGGDNTVFIDNIRVLPGLAVWNPSFDAPQLGHYESQYHPSSPQYGWGRKPSGYFYFEPLPLSRRYSGHAGGWEFSGLAGVCHWSSPKAGISQDPANNGIGFIEANESNSGRISQQITGLVHGRQYYLQFLAARNPSQGPAVLWVGINNQWTRLDNLPSHWDSVTGPYYYINFTGDYSSINLQFETEGGRPHNTVLLENISIHPR